jgi:hypothetical protein
MGWRKGWRKAGLLVCCLALLSPAACAGGSPGRMGAFMRSRTKAAVIPPIGILYTKTTAPVAAGVSGKPLGSRVGRSSVSSIGIPPNPFRIPPVALFSWGDMSEMTSAANGGITKVTHADYEMTVVLLFFRRVTLITYGE